MAIWIVEFSKGGKILERFLPKNQHIQRDFFRTIQQSMMVCQKLRKFKKKKSFKNINLGDHFL